VINGVLSAIGDYAADCRLGQAERGLTGSGEEAPACVPLALVKQRRFGT
jgi:hypothetical protein